VSIAACVALKEAEEVLESKLLRDRVKHAVEILVIEELSKDVWQKIIDHRVKSLHLVSEDFRKLARIVVNHLLQSYFLFVHAKQSAS
jgi:hypothetical protein